MNHSLYCTWFPALECFTVSYLTDDGVPRCFKIPLGIDGWRVQSPPKFSSTTVSVSLGLVWNLLFLICQIKSFHNVSPSSLWLTEWHQPCLSPVNTQILMSASASCSIVCGTPSCNLSSTAVAPNSWKPYMTV